MTYSTYYKKGAWKYRCDQCGAIYKSDYSRLQWDNYRVCPECWDYRHPQELLKAPQPECPIPWSRPDILPANLQPNYHHTGVIDSKAADRVGADMMTKTMVTTGVVSNQPAQPYTYSYLITLDGKFILTDSGSNLRTDT